MQKVVQDKVEVLQGAMSGAPVVLAGFEDTANNLLKAADEAGEPQFAALALIKRAEAIRAELHYTAGDAEQDLVVSQTAKAKETYEAALIKAEGNNSLVAMATYGLGLCDEELGNFDKAKEVYLAIANNDDFKGTIFPAQAQFRLDIMGDHNKQFSFIEAPAPEIVIPEGFDKDAAEALKSGDIYVEPAPAEMTVEEKK
jgi:tetratricopeptide (TPR) repeat protein